MRITIDIDRGEAVAREEEVRHEVPAAVAAVDVGGPPSWLVAGIEVAGGGTASPVPPPVTVDAAGHPR